jgi:hypothetical protein
VFGPKAGTALVLKSQSVATRPHTNVSVISHAWTQTAGPAIQLANANSATPTATLAKTHASYVFRLDVTDSLGRTASTTLAFDTVADNTNPSPVTPSDPDCNKSGATEPLSLTLAAGNLAVFLMPLGRLASSTRRRRWLAAISVPLVVVALLGCGGGGGASPASPSPPPSQGCGS